MYGRTNYEQRINTQPSLTRLVMVVAGMLCGSLSVALGEPPSCDGQTNWGIPGSGSWFVSLYWDNDIPNCHTTANIATGGTALIVGATAQACDVTLGINPEEKGTVSMNNAVLNACSEILVGGYGTGTLTTRNGGSITASLLTIAALDANSSGTMSLAGTSVSITTRCDVGGDNGTPGGVALLSITNGGSVSVSDGYLRVYNCGTLAGNGTITTRDGTTVGGTVSPNGQLTINGNVTFSGDTASLECHVTPASADNVSVSGAASLAGRISVTMTGTTFTAGTTYTLLHAAGGIDPNHPRFDFNSIKGGSGDCFTPVITYDTNNNNVNLYLSPCSN